MAAKRKTVTLEQAAQILGVTDRSLRQIRSNHPEMFPTTKAAPDSGGRPKTLLYEKDVLEARRKIRAGQMEGAFKR